jgi:hypothetical protein
MERKSHEGGKTERKQPALNETDVETEGVQKYSVLYKGYNLLGPPL